MPQVNATELYARSEPLAEVGVEEVQQTTISLHFTALDDGCITMGGYTLPPQETHLGEEDEDKDHATKNGENLDDIDKYEEMIEGGDFDRDVNDHEVAPNFQDENMVDCDEGDVDNDIGAQHVTNTITAYTPPTSSFYANT